MYNLQNTTSTMHLFWCPSFGYILNYKTITFPNIDEPRREKHADPNASARHWLVWTFSSGTMSHTDRHLFCYLLRCQNDSLLSPSPRRSMCRPKRVALRSVFAAAAALCLFLSSVTKHHLIFWVTVHIGRAILCAVITPQLGAALGFSEL